MNAPRSAKSGSDWTAADLIAYNIIVVPVSANDFFRHGANPPLDHLSPAIFAAPGDPNVNVPKPTADYLRYLDLATRASQESFIDNFTAETLKLLGFNELENTLVMTRYVIPLTICGESGRVAQTDVCLLYCPSLVLLVVVEDKTIFNRSDPQPQVVAEAIAAFQFNNTKRIASGLPALDAMTIPCLTMTGTRPTFYLVPVTRTLSEAVMTGQYPETHQTKVLQCATTNMHARRSSEGMEDIEYRKLALKRFLAFKVLAKSHWELFIDGF